MTVLAAIETSAAVPATLGESHAPAGTQGSPRGWFGAAQQPALSSSQFSSQPSPASFRTNWQTQLASLISAASGESAGNAFPAVDASDLLSAAHAAIPTQFAASEPEASLLSFADTASHPVLASVSPSASRRVLAAGAATPSNSSFPQPIRATNQIGNFNRQAAGPPEAKQPADAQASSSAGDRPAKTRKNSLGQADAGPNALPSVAAAPNLAPTIPSAVVTPAPVKSTAPGQDFGQSNTVQFVAQASPIPSRPASSAPVLAKSSSPDPGQAQNQTAGTEQDSESRSALHVADQTISGQTAPTSLDGSDPGSDHHGSDLGYAAGDGTASTSQPGLSVGADPLEPSASVLPAASQPQIPASATAIQLPSTPPPGPIRSSQQSLTAVNTALEVPATETGNRSSAGSLRFQPLQNSTPVQTTAEKEESVPTPGQYRAAPQALATPAASAQFHVEATAQSHATTAPHVSFASTDATTTPEIESAANELQITNPDHSQPAAQQPAPIQGQVQPQSHLANLPADTMPTPVPAPRENLRHTASDAASNPSRPAASAIDKVPPFSAARSAPPADPQTSHVADASHPTAQGAQAIPAQLLNPEAAAPSFAGSATAPHGLLNNTPIASPAASSTASAPGAQETFAALDADQHLAPPSWTQAGAHRAEAGFQDPSLGWIGVRADASGGQVHATVMPGSSDAAQALGGHMAGLNAYLADVHTPVETLTLASPAGRESAFGSTQDQSPDLNQGMNQNFGQNAGQGNQQQPQSNLQPVRPVIAAAVPLETNTTDTHLAPASQLYGQTGAHISVVA